MSVKTNILLRALLFVVFLGGLTIFSQAQQNADNRAARQEITKICHLGTSLQPVDPIIPSICGEGTIQGSSQGHLNSDGDVILSVYAVNLEVNEKGKDVVTYNLPSEYEDIYLEYEQSEGEYIVVGPILEWEYFGIFQKENGPIYPMYRGIVLAEFSRPNNDDCGNILGPTTPYTPYYSFEMGVKLIKADGSLYPIELYAEEDDIFSCKVFEENEFECDETVTQHGRPAYELEICVLCPTLGHIYINPVDHRKKPTTPYSFTLSPNPFSDYIQYQYHSELETEAMVSLLSANGQVLSQKNKNFGIGKNTYLLDTDQLPQGVYFLQITDGKHRAIQRIVKMN